MRPGTLRDHHVQVDRAERYIRTHLAPSIPIAELARIAGFSIRHFQRTFAARTGESPQQHIRRLRLEQAAGAIVRSRKSLLSIALEAGFESHEVFCRAFRLRFGHSPREYRRSHGSASHFRPRNASERWRILLGGHLRSFVERRRGSRKETAV